ncbi:MAG TPA: hypothetical protein VLS25_11910, partial [Dehalococcoidia bacterium]|nr:hypothetical protein [Dehalococcoidia bacterium]
FPESFWYHYEDGLCVWHPGFETRHPPARRYLRPPDEQLSVTDTCVSISTKRQVHYSIGGDAWCTRCEWPFQGYGGIFRCTDAEGSERWLDAVTGWYEGGAGRLECPGCGKMQTIFDVAYDPPWAFGHLAFEFWNWGALRLDFIRDVAWVLGHEVVVPYGKL